jgi:hypothetical protein
MNTTSNRRSFLTTKPHTHQRSDPYTRPSFCKRLSANVVAVVHQNIKGEGGQGRRRLLGDDWLTRMNESRGPLMACRVSYATACSQI